MVVVVCVGARGVVENLLHCTPAHVCSTAVNGAPSINACQRRSVNKKALSLTTTECVSDGIAPTSAYTNSPRDGFRTGSR